MLRGKPYTYSVDYWSLGCILFEFLAGFPPFSGSTPEETWTNLKNWTKVLRRPEYDKPEDLIFNLTDVAWDAITRYISLLHHLFPLTHTYLFQPHFACQRPLLHPATSRRTSLFSKSQMGRPALYTRSVRARAGLGARHGVL